MKLAIQLALGGPMVAALATIALAGWPRRIVVGALALAGVGGCAALLALSLDRGAVGARGFEADPWRAGLALATAMLACAAVAGPAGRPAPLAASLAGAGAGVAGLLATDTFSAAALFVASTLAFGVAGLASGTGGRALAILAASDLALVAGLALASSDGMRVPPGARGAAAAVLVVAALLRSGAHPWADDAVEGSAALGSLALGAMRAQALAIGGWVALGRGDATAALAIAGCLLGAWAAARAVRQGSLGSASGAQCALALAGIGIGGASAARGAVLLAAGSFLGATLATLGRGSLARWSVGAAPLGATFPGAILIVAALLDRSAADRWVLAAALPACAALAWLALAGVAGVRSAPGPAHLAWALPVLAAAAAIALLPDAALVRAAPAAASFGVGEVLGGIDLGLPDDLGLAAAAAALATLVAGLPRAPRARLGAGVAVRPRLAGAAALEIPAVALLGLLFALAVRRGFL